MARSSSRFTNKTKSAPAAATKVENTTASCSSSKPTSGKAYVALAKELKPEKIPGYTYAF